jgi:4-hydroxythreonine-4-phosphate dehydrogenase
MPSPVTLVATVGDPRGIGPEVMSAAARAALDEDPHLRCVVLGWVGPPPFTHERITWEEPPAFDGSARCAGEVSLATLEAGVGLCMRGEAQGLVTGPVHKGALHRAGSHSPGQTELLAELTGAERVGMLMTSEEGLLGHPLRVLLATTHIPLREVPSRVTTELLVEQAELLAEALGSGWGLSNPALALCALNPHASDEGLFGDEEARVFHPAVVRLRNRGVDVTGPLPADTVFRRAASGEFDAVVAPYHDVGMAAFKSLAFGTGVNTTLGLPFPRTSPDHGTAFDIAGLGRADPSSARAAFSLAGRLARARSW